MYRVETVGVDIDAAIAALPSELLPAFAELRVALEVAPWGVASRTSRRIRVVRGRRRSGRVAGAWSFSWSRSTSRWWPFGRSPPIQTLTDGELSWDGALHRSKTDQAGHGTTLGIARPTPETTAGEGSEGSRLLDAGAAWSRWRDLLGARGITGGPAWRGIDRDGRRPRAGGPHRNSIAEIIKRRAAATGLGDAELWGGHSLRRGFATEAILAGVPERDAPCKTNCSQIEGRAVVQEEPSTHRLLAAGPRSPWLAGQLWLSHSFNCGERHRDNADSHGIARP